jgi:hypothetical protein
MEDAAPWSNVGDATFNDLSVGLPLPLSSCIKLDECHCHSPVAGICSSWRLGRLPATALSRMPSRWRLPTTELNSGDIVANFR